MAVSITHTTQSTVTDELEPGIIGPNDWNEAHTISGTLDAAQMPALTGDVTTSAGSVATTLATVNGNVGTFGSATKASVVTVNAKGLVTAASESTVTPAATSITGAGDLTKADDTNVTLTLGGTATGALLKAVSITAGWTGTLAAARLNANVVQGITNDTNVTGSIATQTLTLGWTGQLAVTRGGTGLSTTTQGDILYADASNSLAKLAKSTSSTRYLSNTGTSNNPAWAQVDLTNGVTGALPVANGGTGQTTEAEAIGEMTQALTEDTTPDWAADYIPAYDASADTGKKLLLSTVWREKITSNRTYYVRTDGSDSNTGLANTAGGAFLTLQKAANVVGALDLVAGAVVTIQVGAGTYTAGVSLTKLTGSGTAVLQGDTTTPSNVVISVTNAQGITADSIGSGWTVQGFQISTTTAGQGISLSGTTVLTIGVMRWGAVANSCVYVSFGATASITGNQTFTSGTIGSYVWYAEYGGAIVAQNITCTLTANITFNTWAVAYISANLVLNNNTYTTGGFTATGTKYNANYVSTITSNATIFGSVAGSASNSSYYI